MIWWHGAVWGWGLIVALGCFVGAWLTTFDRLAYESVFVILLFIGCTIIILSVLVPTPVEDVRLLESHTGQFQQVMSDFEWEVIAKWSDQTSEDPTKNHWLVEKSNPHGTLRGRLQWIDEQPSVDQVFLVPEAVLKAEKESHVIVRIVAED